MKIKYNILFGMLKGLSKKWKTCYNISNFVSRTTLIVLFQLFLKCVQTLVLPQSQMTNYRLMASFSGDFDKNRLGTARQPPAGS